MRYFFFPAENGIRYAQESRGLGDVYKGKTEAVLLFSVPPRILNNNAINSLTHTAHTDNDTYLSLTTI